MCLLVTNFMFEVLLVSPLFTWKWAFVIISFMIAISTCKSYRLCIVSEPYSILNYFNFLNISTFLPLLHIRVIFVHYEIILKLLVLETSWFNPHEASVERENQKTKSKEEAWRLQSKLNKNEGCKWSEKATSAHPRAKCYNKLLRHCLHVPYYCRLSNSSCYLM